MAGPMAGAAGTYAPGELLVQFQPGVDATGVAGVLGVLSGHLAEYVRGFSAPQGALARVELPAGLDVSAAANLFSRLPGVAFAEPNFILHAQATPSEPAYAGGSLWGMEGDLTTPANAYGSQAGEAWAAGYTGSTSVAVGVVDTGIDYTHPDLYQNIWINQGEVPAGLGLVDVDGDHKITFRDLNAPANAGKVADSNGNGRIDGADILKAWSDGDDQDGNGYKDDLIGWDFVNNDNNPYDDNSHGTHVAGTIGATPNDGGVVGVNWAVQLAALKFLDANGSGTTANAIKALDYLTQLQAHQAAVADPAARIDVAASNNSWGGDAFSQAMLDAIVRGGQQDILFIAAAGNGNVFGVGQNNDSTPFYPASYSTLGQGGLGYDAVIAVAAITSAGAKASFSNYGAKSVDLGAPGDSIYSDVPGGGLGTKSGTSMAAPHVTGAVALYSAAVGPGVSAAAIRQALLGATDPTSSLAGITVTGGRLDIGRLMASLTAQTPAETVVIASAYDDEGASTGALATGATTDDASPLLQGTVSSGLASGETVEVFRDGTLIGQASVNGQQWSYQDAGVPAGGHSWTATVANLSGQTGPVSTPFTLTVQPLNVIWGTSRNDTITGTAQADKIYGVSSAQSDLGRGQIDTLRGGGGADVFVLGDARGRFYDDGRATSSGTGDYAQIADFTPGEDKIQVRADAAHTLTRALSLGGHSGTGVYFDTNNSGAWDSRDELIGFVWNAPSLAPSDFIFV